MINRDVDPVLTGEMTPHTHPACITTKGKDMPEPIHIISLGAGVQSSCMALMAAHGEIRPRPVAAIFADTQDEPASVYAWLDQLERLIAAAPFPFPVHRLSEGMLSDAVFARGSVKAAGANHYIGLPTYQRDGFGQRHCTKYFKVLPVRRKAREIACGSPVKMWIGISVDEVTRCKPSGLLWCENKWPLIDARMNRRDCEVWLARRTASVPPKSACVYCPYNSDAMWRRRKAESDWPKIVEIDAKLRKRGQYLHRSLQPINDVDLSTEEERGQLDMFQNECEGMCGV